MSGWAFVKELDAGTKVYVERASIVRDGAFITALIRYDVLGTDPRNGKAGKGFLAVEEYDTGAAVFRVHAVQISYEDDSLSDPLGASAEWMSVRNGNQHTFEFLRCVTNC